MTVSVQPNGQPELVYVLDSEEYLHYTAWAYASLKEGLAI